MPAAAIRALKAIHQSRLFRRARAGQGPIRLSAILTVHNEGEELPRTLSSLRGNTQSSLETIVIDDGSDDDCCDNGMAKAVSIIRHEARIGVAASRSEGVAIAGGNVLCFLDGHHRFSPRCLDHCAELALKRDAIVCPNLLGYHREGRVMHGASFHLCPEHKFFSAGWNFQPSRRRVSRVSALRAPPYLIPRTLYEKVRWIRGLKGWGGSEAAVSLKAFFLDVDILHLCGPVAWHLFKKKFHYEVTWDEIWRNQALIARVCFSDRTWFEHWLPNVFDPHLTPEARRDLESAEILAQHEEFQAQKLRTDRDFWRILLKRRPPACLQ